ncbi:MAG: ABC transporter permease [Gammaproteobacteria bacterium]
MFRLALRNLLRQKMRTFITLASIVFGVAALILAGGFVEDIFVQLREATIHSRTGYIQLYRTGYYEFGRRDPYQYLIEDPAAMIKRLRRIPEVTDILQRLNFTGLVNNGKTDRSIIGEGVEPGKEAELGTFLKIIEGRMLQADDGYTLMIGEGVAQSLDLKPSDLVTVIATTEDGAMNSLEFQVVGVFRSFSQEFDARAIRMPLTAAQELLYTDKIHSIVFSLTSSEVVEPVANLLRRSFAADRYETKTWEELDDFYRKTVNLYKRQFGVLQLIILGIVLLSVANSVSMTANERVGEFGTLRAVGHSSNYVYRLLILENSVLGAVGAMIGVLVGVGLAYIISKFGIPMPPPPNANGGYTALIRIIPQNCVIAFLIGVFATIMSALLACRGPTRVHIADALRQNI